MPIKVLEIIHYPRHGDEWDRELIREPDTAAIEGAICRLDRDEWPYLWLHARESVDGEMPEGALCVMGGRGEYSLSVWADGDEIHYLDPKRGDEPIRIWESDQGSVLPERNLCGDRSLVLRIARLFAETGMFVSRTLSCSYVGFGCGTGRGDSFCKGTR